MGEIRTEALDCEVDGVRLQAHLALDGDVSGPRPAVLVVHEWWGRNAYACGRAEQLAALGYVGIAVDLYGDAKEASNPDEAGAAMTALIEDMTVTRARFTATLEAARAHPAVDASRVGAIGFCFGGGVVVHMARSGAPLAAVASFHGSLGLAVTDGPDSIDCRVAAYNGEQDVLVSADDIGAFQAEMAKVGAHTYFVQLPGALHGFSNPAATGNGEKYGLPLAYDPVADAAAWSHMTLLFRDVFGS
jgi:dienelactone hydrolase